jgi:uncharacterized membrane protein HdeD (DUF308 family)
MAADGMRQEVRHLMTARAICALVLGVAVLAWPDATVRVVGLLFTGYAFVDGGLSIGFASARGDEARPSWELGIEGATGLAFAVLALVAAWTDAAVLAFVVGLWAVMAGALSFSAAVVSARHAGARLSFAVAGLATVGLGAMLFGSGELSAVAVGRLLGVWALAIGAVLASIANRLRRDRLAGTVRALERA